MVMMGAVVFAYLGMLALCLGLERHYKQVWGRVPARGLRVALRVAGWLALAVSFWLCGLAWGWAIGPVAWCGVISLAGFVLVMVLPYWPRVAVWLVGVVPVWLVGVIGVGWGHQG